MRSCSCSRSNTLSPICSLLLHYLYSHTFPSFERPGYGWKEKAQDPNYARYICGCLLFFKCPHFLTLSPTQPVELNDMSSFNPKQGKQIGKGGIRGNGKKKSFKVRRYTEREREREILSPTKL